MDRHPKQKPKARQIGPSQRDFQSHKNQILAGLATDCPDKSKKGGVDAPIYDLLRFLNGIPDYVSTSSCSGRVAVFSESPDKRKDAGNWLYVSHEAVSKDSEDLLVNAIIQAAPNSSSIYFKFEPFILHISCATLEAGQRLMKVVLQCGFKNSGMLVGKRIMVAVRSTLKLDVPVAMDSKLLVSTEYLRLLVNLSNEKFKKNILDTNKYYKALQQEFVENKNPTTHSGTVPGVKEAHRKGYNGDVYEFTSSEASKAVGEARKINLGLKAQLREIASIAKSLEQI